MSVSQAGQEACLVVVHESRGQPLRSVRYQYYTLRIVMLPYETAYR